MRDDFLGGRGGTTSLPNRFFGDGDAHVSGIRQCDRPTRQYGSGGSLHVGRRTNLGKRLERCGLPMRAWMAGGQSKVRLRAVNVAGLL